MIRAIALCCGLASAALFSQAPEFTQQYIQRLSGAVNELRVIAAGFDLAAAAAGKTRAEALAASPSNGFEGQLKETIAISVRRFERLEADLNALAAADPMRRLAMPLRMSDRQLLEQTYAAYKPAVPLTAEGGMAALFGYFLGWITAFGALSLILRPFRRVRPRRFA